MEPLSALGLAAGVVQFVQFAGTLVSLGSTIHRSTDGKHEWSRELERIYGRLDQFSSRLQHCPGGQVLKPQGGGGWLAEPEPPAEVDVRALGDLAKECHDLCRQLLDTVGKLRVQPGSSHRALKTFRAVLRTVWDRQKIADLETRLDRIQKVLSLHFYPVLR